MEVIKAYFPEIRPESMELMQQLPGLYGEWNAKINVISRKDLDELSIRHILHSLAIARIQTFSKGDHVLDIGTGGGFPGIPLAIMFPQATFTLVDSIGKKIKVVNAICDALGLQNVQAVNDRVERLSKPADFIVSRAVAPTIKLVEWSKSSTKKNTQHLLLKGGDLTAERDDLWTHYPKAHWTSHQLSDWFKEPFFETKKLIRISDLKA